MGLYKNLKVMNFDLLFEITEYILFLKNKCVHHISIFKIMNYNSASSTHRKDQQSSRYQGKSQQYNVRQQLSATTRNLTSQKQTLMQQQQIADLERKIDLILMHNEKLQSEKQRYRAMLQDIRSQNTERALQSNTARFITEQNQMVIQKLRRQLEISARTYERRLNQAFQSRQILKQQIQTLSKIIEELNQQNRDLKLIIKQQQIKVDSLQFDLKEQFIRQQIQLQNKLRDQFLIRQIELKNERKQAIDAYQSQIQDLKREFQNQKQAMQKRNEQHIKELMEAKREQIQKLIKDLNSKFQNQKLSILEQHMQDLKRQRENATQYINQNIQNVQNNDQQIKQEYVKEINRLRESLDARRRLIDSLLAQQSPSFHQINSQQSRQFLEPHFQSHKAQQYIQSSRITQISWFEQLMSLKEQLRKATNQYLQQSELLKLKLTEKFQIDIRQMKKIYENKIQLMGFHTEKIQTQNTRLRHIYETTLHNQIQVKKDFELEKSKLKNLIRKLKVELHGIQEQFRINIEGVRDQNNTFSMTMMKSMIQVKEKANFFAQQNRKLRKAYEEHQKQTNQTVKQAGQKVSYYQSKYQSLKERLNLIIGECKQKIELIQLQSEERQNNLRQSLNKEHQMIQLVVEKLRNQCEQLISQNQNLKRNCHQIECTFKEKDQDIAYYKSKVDQLEADVQRLKMDLQMAGVNDKDKTDTINQWKNHYQNIISQLQQEKNIIIQKCNQKDEQLTQIVKKYKLLENQLDKVVNTLKKRTLIEKKVLEVGLDKNLVKNLAQLFQRKSEEKNKENY